MKYKNEYCVEDIKCIENICNKLIEITKRVIVKLGKSTFGKEIWVCSCGIKVSINENVCSCGRSKNGLTREEVDIINATIKHLNKVKKILEVEFASK